MSNHSQHRPAFLNADSHRQAGGLDMCVLHCCRPICLPIWLRRPSSLTLPLQVLWLLGVLGGLYVATQQPDQPLPLLIEQQPWTIWFVGPAAAAVTGIAQFFAPGRSGGHCGCTLFETGCPAELALACVCVCLCDGGLCRDECVII